ncbi:MAG: packaged DNA stabilization protein [Caulobacter sp.]|nr:packaged DNA stabilization protein [Caulobacter sp.]
MIIPFADTAYSRPSYGLPAARVVNYFPEKAFGSESVRLPRPGLSDAAPSYTVGAGPVRGIYSKPGVFDGDKFTVSGTALYRETALIGAVAGEGIVSFAASASQLVVVSGGTAYVYDGSSFNAISDPDLPAVAGVVTLAGRFIYTTVSSDRYYWSAVNDAADIDGLDFATAEGSPDATVAVAVLGDELFFFGSDSTEIWFPTGDLDAPFQRTQGRRYTRGCAAAASVVQMDNTLIWVGDDRIVYRAESVPRAIGDAGISETLRDSANLAQATAFWLPYDQHAYYVLNIPGEKTYVLDVTTARWAEWSSFQRTTLRVQCATIDDGQAFLGDDETGRVWLLSADAFSDGENPITGLLTAIRPQSSGVARNFVVVLECTRGVGNADSPDPVVELRWSDDNGRTFGAWRSATLGKVGEYANKPIWRRLGSVKSPGRIYEVRITDPVMRAVRHLVSDEQRVA